MLVVDWMTPNVVAVKPGTSLLKCRNLLKEKNIRRLPVVDDANKVVGIVSDRDVRGASPSKATTLEVHEMQYLLAELKAKDIMTPRPLTVKPDATVEEAALLMLDRKIGGLPVVNDEGTLVGIISHVPALRERISAQIAVIPEAGGLSRLEGAGCSRVE